MVLLRNDRAKAVALSCHNFVAQWRDVPAAVITVIAAITCGIIVCSQHIAPFVSDSEARHNRGCNVVGVKALPSGLHLCLNIT